MASQNAGEGGGGALAGAIKAGEAFVELAVRDNAFYRGLGKAKAALEGIGSLMRTTGAISAGLGAAVLGPLAVLFNTAAERADALQKMSGRLGETTEALSAIGYAAEASGTNLEDFEGAAKKLQVNLSDAVNGSESAAAAFEALGLSAESLQGMSLENQFLAIADAMAKIEDPADRTRMTVDLLGKSGTKLANMFKDGSGALKGLFQEAADVGAVVTSERAAQAEKALDAISRVQLALKYTILEVGSAFIGEADSLEDLSFRIISGVKVVREFIAENRQLIIGIAGVASGAVAAGTVLLGVGTTIGVGLGAAGLAISGIVSVATSAWGVLAGGFGLLVGLPAAIGAGISGLVAFAPLIPVIAVGLASVAATSAVVAAGWAALAGVVVGAGYIFVKHTDLGKAALAGVKGYASDAADWFMGAWGNVVEYFQAVSSTVMSTWGVVRDSVGRGDWKGAWTAALAGLEVEYRRAMVQLTKLWTWFDETVIERARGMWVDMKLMWNDARAYLETQFVGLLHYFRHEWKGLGPFIADVFSLAMGMVEKRFTKMVQFAVHTLIPIAGLVREETLTAGLQLLDGTTSEAINAAEIADQKLKELEAKIENPDVAIRTAQEIEAERAANERRIREDAAKGEAERAAGRVGLVGDALDALFGAKAANWGILFANSFKNAMAEAEAELKGLAKAFGGGGGGDDPAAKFVEQIGTSVRGAFSLRNASQIFGGQATGAEKAAQAQQRVPGLLEINNKKLDEIKKAIERNDGLRAT